MNKKREKTKIFFVFCAVLLLLVAGGGVQDAAPAAQQQTRELSAKRISVSEGGINNNETISCDTQITCPQGYVANKTGRMDVDNCPVLECVRTRTPDRSAIISASVAEEIAKDKLKLTSVRVVGLREPATENPVYEMNGYREIYVTRGRQDNLSIRLEIDAENGMLDRISLNGNGWIELDYGPEKENFSEEIRNRVVKRITSMKISDIRKQTASTITKTEDADLSNALSRTNCSVNWNAEIQPMSEKFKRTFLFALENADDDEKNRIGAQLDSYANAIHKKRIERENITRRLMEKDTGLLKIREMLQRNAPMEEILNSISG